MDKLSDDELLFYGSVEVNFAYHYGSIHLSSGESELQLDHDTSTLQSLLSVSDNDNYQELVLPEIPATCVQISSTNGGFESIPDIFRYPLIKSKLSSPWKGIVSGTRSALIKLSSSEWYRLKGCGNDTDGFPIRPVSDSNDKVTIRGCAFLHSTHRELVMTKYISNLLSTHQIECANIPIGWFEYQPTNTTIHSDVPTVQDIHLNQWANVSRCCILMKTLGNKRLSDHILYGIEQLFSLVVSNNKHTHPIDYPSLISLFPQERLTKGEQLEPLSTWFASIANILQPIDYYNSNWLHPSAHFSTQIPTDTDEHLWVKHINVLNEYLQTNGKLADLLCSIYKRFGFECGSILGLMHYHRISWGTYTDELGIHCNAHPNNLVMKLLSAADSFLLAPLDFDMSFTEKTYQPSRMNVISFDEIIQLELSGFQLTLAGDSQINSGVTAWVDMPDYQWTSSRWLLRDIMLNEFNRTYHETCQKGSTAMCEIIPDEQNCAVQALIRLALIRTMREIA
ncbi:unnamed protein product [Adineta ricciae]|uniref:Uncharacterized protein n=1 Tax=Adineta ricciae TaxID=249248 RepID=A0A813NKL8_ADIRI|nr:unnamed protein product [Adineta ricciae]CAF1388716.1 unnamed protein product [Adineta ricciae]